VSLAALLLALLDLVGIIVIAIHQERTRRAAVEAKKKADAAHDKIGHMRHRSQS
jgi:hypothetical protein